jgi:hypothetical protein
MRAAVVHQPGDTPVAFVNDQFPLRRLQPPCVAGYEAIVELPDGTRWYVTAPPSPYGTLAAMEGLGLVLLEVRQPEPHGESPQSCDDLPFSSG